METSNDILISLLAVKELEIKELNNYIIQLEDTYNNLAVKYNKLNEKFYTKQKRTQIGFKQNN